MHLLDLIEKKARGGAHDAEELAFIASSAASGSVPDYQLSSWLMAVRLNGMSPKETADLTRAMAATGSRLSFDGQGLPAVDKHSTGGVGDAVTIALAPLAACAGLAVPTMSGRGLGHTGGTLDKLESLPGFQTRLDVPRILDQVARLGACLFGQSADLAPADRKLYHLRDASGTVPSLPLIVSSILSKKVAEGLSALVLDVKCGSGAIFPKAEQALPLARALVATAKKLGLRCAALLTAMEEPLGKAVGNAVELEQAIAVLKGAPEPRDFIECTLELGSWMVYLGGKAKSPAEAKKSLAEILKSGRALERFKEIVRAQGGDESCVDEPGRLPRAQYQAEFKAPRPGHLSKLDARRVGQAAVALGAGRRKMEDAVDPAAGILLLKKVGDPVKKGEPIARLLSSNDSCFDEALRLLQEGTNISTGRPSKKPLIIRILR